MAQNEEKKDSAPKPPPVAKPNPDSDNRIKITDLGPQPAAK